MTLFKGRDQKERSRKRIISTCCVGEVIDISKVSSPAISSKILGEGFGVLCSEAEIVSPTSGTVKDISDNGHTYTIQQEDGLSVLVCITFKNKSEQLEPEVEPGQAVTAGELLCRKENAEAAVIMTNPEILTKYRIALGRAKTNTDGVIIYEK